MRIALLHPFVWPEVRRGGERYLDDIAWAMRQRGHAVDILTGTPGAPSVETREDGAVIRRVWSRRVPRLGRYGIDSTETFGLFVLPSILRHRYDVVHALVPGATLAARIARQPTVYSLIGHPGPGTASSVHRMKRRIVEQAVRQATLTAALSEASAAAAYSLTGRHPRVLEPGIRLDRFPVEHHPRSGPPVVLFASSASDRRKGLDVLLVAFARLLERWPQARLQIAGPGDPEWALSALDPPRPDVRSAIDFLGAGKVDDLPSLYRRATVTVLPSRDEAFGLVLVESLASGTPVVCSRSGGMPEIVTDAAVGRLAAPDDPDDLAGAIHDAIGLAADPATPARCHAHARHWSWQGRVGETHEAIYQEAARSG